MRGSVCHCVSVSPVGCHALLPPTATHKQGTHTYTPPANCPWHEHSPRLTGRHLRPPILKPTLYLAAAPNKRQRVWGCLSPHVCWNIQIKATLCICLTVLVKQETFSVRITVNPVYFWVVDHFTVRRDLSAHLRLPARVCRSLCPCACKGVSAET